MHDADCFLREAGLDDIDDGIVRMRHSRWIAREGETRASTSPDIGPHASGLHLSSKIVIPGLSWTRMLLKRS